MSDSKGLGEPDPPPEYAEAYHRAYQNAYQPTADQAEAPGGDERTQVLGPLFADEVAGGGPTRGTETFASLDSMMTDAPEEPPAPVGDEPQRPAWLVPALLGALVVLLLAGAFGIGKLFSSQMDSGSASQAPNGVVTGDGGATGSGGSTHAPQGKKYDGPTDAVAIGGADATCQSKNSVDAAGHKVDYRPRNVYDGDMTTAWRCNGDGHGEKLTLQLPAKTKIGEVGLVPGYAKTDPRSGADRYAQNNRITKVRWLFDDGTAVEQTFDGSPRNREMQSMRIPLTETGTVQVEILHSTPGPRRTIAVSEVRLGQPQ